MPDTKHIDRVAEMSQRATEDIRKTREQGYRDALDNAWEILFVYYHNQGKHLVIAENDE